MLGLLSIPTWIIHFGSVIEWGIAMFLFYVLGRHTGNIWLKRMPLFMIPYGLSGVCAILYHLTYDTLNIINDAQAYLTLAGSCCFAIWAWLLLRDLTTVQKTKNAGLIANKPETSRLSYKLRQPSQQSSLEDKPEEVSRG